MARRNRLKNLSISELSLVDKGANQGALQILRKRGTSALSRLLKSVLDRDEEPEELAVVTEMSDALSVSVASIIEKHGDDPEALEAALEETLGQFRAHVLSVAKDGDGDDDESEYVPLADGETGKKSTPKKKKAGDMAAACAKCHTIHKAAASCPVPTTEEHIMDRATLLKGLSPDAAAYIDALETQTKEAITKAETAHKAAEAATTLANSTIEKLVDRDRTAKVAELIGKDAPIALADAVALYKSAEQQVTAGDAKAIERVETLLKRQSELGRTSRLFTEDGTDDADSPSAAHAELTKIAQEIVKASNGKVSFQKAYTQACAQNPELYEDVVDEQDESAE